jgi:general secretion pathway protein J
MKSSQRGFTLIELLISLAIMGFISIVAFQLIGSGYRVQSAVREESKKLEYSARTWLKIQMDFEQIVDRAIRDNQGSQEPALKLYDGKLSFTRTGWVNPLKKERSQYQRLEYYIQDKQLNRVFWETLDRDPDSESRTQIFDKITQFDIQVMTKKGQWVTEWPQLDEKQHYLPGLPLAIQVTLGIDNEPTFTRIFEVASYTGESK